MKGIAFILVLAAWLLPAAAQAQLPFLPDKVDATVRLEITRIRHGRWPWLPWRRDSMKKMGWTPPERRGRTRAVEIRSQVILSAPPAPQTPPLPAPQPRRPD